MGSNCLILPYKENIELQKLLMYEKNTLEYLVTIRDLMFLTNNNEPTIFNKISVNFLYTVNNILLDNITRYVVTKNSNRFITLLNNNTLLDDLYINPVYLEQLSDVLVKDEIDRFEIERLISERLLNYIKMAYRNTLYVIKEVIFNLYTCIEKFLSNIYIRYYRVEVLNTCSPVIFIETNNHALNSY